MIILEENFKWHLEAFASEHFIWWGNWTYWIVLHTAEGTMKSKLTIPILWNIAVFINYVCTFFYYSSALVIFNQNNLPFLLHLFCDDMFTGARAEPTI